jgi:2,4-dienoyl-CoA reductase-like NADH-dependent reductase (Old Yellow Enzyme family)
MSAATGAAAESALFSPLHLGELRLRNRVVMAPLTRCRADPGRVPNDLMVEHYRQRVGAGLILTEATSISPMAVGYPDTPGIWSEEQVAGWARVTAAVHAAGGCIVLQLWHVGRISDPRYLNGALPVAPSAIAAPGHVSRVRPPQPFVTPRALSTAEVRATVGDYRRAAENARRAGFDGVELHGANGYLIEQFLRSSTNRRDDQYGGSRENRARFALEATDAVIEVWGAGRVGMHLSPRADNPLTGDEDPAATYGYLAAELGRRGLAFLCLRESADAPRLTPALKRAFAGPVIANESLDLAAAGHLLRTGEADAAAWGRWFIANPDLPRRLREGLPLNEPRPESFFTRGPEGYTDYPALPEVA